MPKRTENGKKERKYTIYAHRARVYARKCVQSVDKKKSFLKKPPLFVELENKTIDNFFGV